MATTPILSIILPVYNGEAFIKRTIKSVLAQDLRDWELIIVNDGSTDQSDAIISDFCALDLRITKISQENKGLSAARNAGYYKAKGKYIVFLDADDFVEPNYYRMLISSTEQSGADFVVSSYIRDFVQPNGNINSKIINFERQKLNSREQIRENCSQMYFYNVYIHVWNKIYRHDFLLQHEIVFDESLRYAEDVPYNIAILKHAKSIQFLDIPGYHYVCHQAERLTGTWRESLIEDNARVYKQVSNFEKKHWNLESTEINAENGSSVACGMYLRSCFLSIEKAIVLGLSYKEIRTCIYNLLESSEVRECVFELKKASPSLEFRIYKIIMQWNQPLLFYWAVILRKKIKQLLRR